MGIGIKKNGDGLIEYPYWKKKKKMNKIFPVPHATGKMELQKFGESTIRA